MAFVAFLGCDGSGKSAVIESAATRLREKGIPIATGHWRPEAFRSEPSGTTAATADDPHGQTPRGTISSSLKLSWLWANWWGGWWRNIGKRARLGVVLFDRYHADLLVDPRRYRYGGPMWLARLASRCMPQPDAVFFLDAEPDVLLSRKQEVSREALATARKAYLELCTGNSRCHVIDASRPLEDVVADVCGKIAAIR